MTGGRKILFNPANKDGALAVTALTHVVIASFVWREDNDGPEHSQDSVDE
jgi:hypothetical protein